MNALTLLRAHAAHLTGNNLIGDVTVTADENNVTLHCEGRTETFTVSGAHLTGRGGTFDLTRPGDADLAVMTVHAGEPARNNTSLIEYMNTHGFELRLCPQLEPHPFMQVLPGRLVHPDGRTLWLAQTFTVYPSGQNEGELESSGVLISAYVDRNEDDEPRNETLIRFHPPHPDVLTALIERRDPDPAQLVPRDFFTS